MLSSIITDKGQTTIPKQVRELLKLKPGDRIEYIVEPGGRVSVRAVTRRLAELRGMLAPVKRRLSVNDMKDAVASAAVERFRRSR
jgi:AbrB family looped-hinge helix DNA binding protein